MKGHKRGSSLAYVILMIALLGIFATGFMYMTEFNTGTSRRYQAELQNLYLGKSVHRTVCRAAENGDLEVLERIVETIAEESDAKEYQASTGDTEIELENGVLATVRIDLSYYSEIEYPRVVIETYTSVSEGKSYVFAAELRRGEEDDRWIVFRHYDPLHNPVSDERQVKEE